MSTATSVDIFGSRSHHLDLIYLFRSLRLPGLPWRFKAVDLPFWISRSSVFVSLLLWEFRISSTSDNILNCKLLNSSLYDTGATLAEFFLFVTIFCIFTALERVRPFHYEFAYSYSIFSLKPRISKTAVGEGLLYIPF